MKKKIKLGLALFISILGIYGLLYEDNAQQISISNPIVVETEENTREDTKILMDNVPEYSGAAYVTLNGNVPEFAEEEITNVAYIKLSELDELGRCGTAIACLGPETITNTERGSIGHIKPSGWHTIKYPGIISDLYLYNRCHLLMYKASGILDDERNLITGTRYLNVDGMLPFETSLVDYIEASRNHVMYRVTPIFKKNNMVASGVKMEALSVEDNGQGLSFNVYCYNVQPGISINYSNGESKEE